MPLRVVTAGIGALLGLAIWYIFIDSMGLLPVAHAALYAEHRGGQTLGYFVGSMLACMLCGGALALYLAERLRLIPTQERVDESARPPSIL